MRVLEMRFLEMRFLEMSFWEMNNGRPPKRDSLALSHAWPRTINFVMKVVVHLGCFHYTTKSEY